MNDADAIAAAQSGHPENFEFLIDRHYGSVYAVAYAWLTDRHAAEDLAQEVFLRAYLHVAELRPEGLGGWLVRVTQNLATDWLRSNRTSSRLLPLVALPESPDAAPSAVVSPDALELQEQQAMVHAALQTLPPELREIVLLHYAEGMCKADIAEQLGVHASTVGRQIEKALEILRASLEPRLRETGPSLRPSRHSRQAALAVIAAAAALTPSARASLLDAAAQTPVLAASSTTVTPPLLGTAAKPLSKGISGMSPIMKIVLVSVAAVGLGLGASHMRSGKVQTRQGAVANQGTTRPASASAAATQAATSNPTLLAGEPDYSSPEATAATYTKAVGSSDWTTAVACFLPGGTDWQDVHDIASAWPGTRDAKLKRWMEAADPTQPIRIKSKTSDREFIVLVWEFTYGKDVTIGGKTYHKGDKGEWDAHFARTSDGQWLIENF